MKTTLLFSLIIGFRLAHSLDFQHLPNPRDEGTDYDRICNNLNITINFSGLSMNLIKENFLSSPIITCLDLNKNEIRSIDVNAFNNLPNLKYLDLSNNQFSLNNIFSNSYNNIETLILDSSNSDETSRICLNNCFSFYDIKLHNVYPKLKKIFIRNTGYSLKLSSSSNFNFPNLTHLYLSGTKIFSDNFNWIPYSLEYLDISGHKLRTFSIENLKNLKWLFLDNPDEKKLTKINLKNLINLQYLSAPSNNIQRIDSSTFNNVNSLIFLDLSNNGIRYIENNSFENMKNLQFLNLSKNYLKDIDSDIFNKLGNLKMLALAGNRIPMFPTITNKLNLKALFLNCNEIKSIVGGTFLNMPKLELLYLHVNQISYIDQEAFAGLKNLKTLTLSNNMLSSLPFNWMLPMISIERLDLTGNNFVNFENLALSDISPLNYLYLSKQVKFIKSTSLEMVPENVTISLDPDYKFVEQC